MTCFGSPRLTSGRSWRPWPRCSSVSSRGACSAVSSERLPADCVLARPGERHAIVAGLSGTVVDVLVNTGDMVEPGEAVARVRLPDMDGQARIARARVDVLAAQVTDDPGLETRLRAARAEAIALDAAADAGGLVVSPVAGEVTAIDLVPGMAVATGDTGRGDPDRERPSAAGGCTHRPGACEPCRGRHGRTGAGSGR